jgi:hypothetical protein
VEEEDDFLFVWTGEEETWDLVFNFLDITMCVFFIEYIVGVLDEVLCGSLCFFF